MLTPDKERPLYRRRFSKKGEVFAAFAAHKDEVTTGYVAAQ